MAKVVTFGEIMLRLKSPAYERLFQSPSLEATFGGGEANVSVSLANYGMETAFVTVLPTNDVGNACIRELRGFGVDTTKIVRKDGRMGIYYLETGAVQRPSKVIYDRAGSAIAEAKPGDIDWDKAFEGATWFHLTGITPAISQGAADLSLEAVKAAKAKGIHVSCDLNYRKNLWKYGKDAKEVMTELVKYVDTVIANEEDFQKSLGLKAESQGDVEDGALNIENYKAIASLAMQTYPNIKRVAITLRESKSANHNDWSACLYNGARKPRSVSSGGTRCSARAAWSTISCFSSRPPGITGTSSARRSKRRLRQCAFPKRSLCRAGCTSPFAVSARRFLLPQLFSATPQGRPSRRCGRVLSAFPRRRRKRPVRRRYPIPTPGR